MVLRLTLEHIARSKMHNVFRWIRPYFLIVLLYILWIACGLIVMPYVSVQLPNEWIALVWLSFIVFIPFFLMPSAVGAIIAKLMWTIGSKKLRIKGFDFCETRGPGKNVNKDVVQGITNPKYPGLDVDFEIQDYGSLSQFGMEGPFDAIYPVGCIEDDGIEALIEGVPSWYAPEDLPEPIRSRYIRERVDPITGETSMEILRRKRGIALVAPALNPIKKVIVGANYLHDEVQLQQQMINNLRRKLRLMSLKYGEEITVKEVEKPQEVVIATERR